MGRLFFFVCAIHFTISRWPLPSDDVGGAKILRLGPTNYKLRAGGPTGLVGIGNDADSAVFYHFERYNNLNLCYAYRVKSRRTAPC